MTVVIVEMTTHRIFQRLQEAAWAHNGELRYVWWLYLIALAVASLFLFANLLVTRVWTITLPLTLIVLVLAHCNYIVWTIECCSGG